jgi:predicted ATP-dependent serine protease
MVRLIGSITGLLPHPAYSVERNFVARVLLPLKGRLGPVEKTGIFEAKSRGIMRLFNCKTLTLDRQRLGCAANAGRLASSQFP